MRTLLIPLALVMSMACTEPSARASAQKPQTDTVIICKSKNAHAYHRYECRGLKHCTYTLVKMTKDQAVKLGYSPCKVCYR